MPWFKIFAMIIMPLSVFLIIFLFVSQWKKISKKRLVLGSEPEEYRIIFEICSLKIGYKWVKEEQVAPLTPRSKRNKELQELHYNRIIYYGPVILTAMYKTFDMYLDWATWHTLKTTNTLYEAASFALLLPITIRIPILFQPDFLLFEFMYDKQLKDWTDKDFEEYNDNYGAY